MRDNAVSTVRLDRQKAMIEWLSVRIDEREARGEPVSLSLSLLSEEKRLYASMLGRAPLDVLDAHASGPCFT